MQVHLKEDSALRQQQFTVLLAGISAALVAMSLSASAAAAAKEPSTQNAVSSRPSVLARQVTSCGRHMTIYTPRTPDGVLSATALHLPGGPGSILGMAARRHFHWISTLSCKLRPAPSRPVPAARRAANNYLNWSGYVDSTSSPDYVQATWYVPEVVNDHNGPDLSSIWPGIGDGATRGTDLIQDGTEQDLSTSNKATYYFWIETYPRGQQEITNLAAHVGDKVSVSASYGVTTKGDAEFVVCDDTQGKCVAGGESANKPDNHAEWITERTAYCKNGHLWLPALAPFTIARFSGAYYDLNGEQNPEYPISHGSPVITYMKDVHGSRLATPGSLGSGGTAFNVTWNDYGVPSEFEPPVAC
jgi:hypothetical protein